MKIYAKDKFFSDNIGIKLMPHRDDRDEPEHLHEFIEMVYIVSGSGVHGVGGREYRVERGSLLFINYRQIHYFRMDELMEYIDILIDPKWISEKLIDSENAFELLTLTAFSDFQSLEMGRSMIRFEGAARSRIERLLEMMRAEYENKEKGYESVLKAQLNILLTLVFRKMLPMVGNLDFAEYIKEHSDEKLTLESLAKDCFYNPSYFSRFFKEHYGMTVTEYISKSRIEKASELLEDTTLSIGEIMEQVGYSGKTAFYKRFAEIKGMTPQQYRKSKNQVPTR